MGRWIFLPLRLKKITDYYFVRLTVTIGQLLRLTANTFAVLRLTVNPAAVSLFTHDKVQLFYVQYNYDRSFHRGEGESQQLLCMKRYVNGFKELT